MINAEKKVDKILCRNRSWLSVFAGERKPKWTENLFPAKSLLPRRKQVWFLWQHCHRHYGWYSYQYHKVASVHSQWENIFWKGIWLTFVAGQIERKLVGGAETGFRQSIYSHVESRCGSFDIRCGSITSTYPIRLVGQSFSHSVSQLLPFCQWVLSMCVCVVDPKISGFRYGI